MVMYPSRAHGILLMLSTLPTLHACRLQAAHRPVGAGPEQLEAARAGEPTKRDTETEDSSYFKNVRMEDGRKGI